ncbi:MAG: hypothetical protein ACTSP3_10375 [Candidatus Heimdallarchaeaceae archaeon]
MKTTMIRVSQKSLNIDTLDELYSALEEEELTIKRIFDPRYSFSGDDLVIEGEIDGVLEKLSQDLPKIISLRFTDRDFSEQIEPKSALNLQHETTKIFFGTTLVDYDFIYPKLRVNEKKKILPLLFRTQLGGQFISLMPVKIKGIVITNTLNQSIEFILPVQRIETLKAWLTTMISKEKINFDTLVDIYRETDPVMRRNMEKAMEWIATQLPEIVAKSALIENIDIVRAYQSTLALM